MSVSKESNIFPKRPFFRQTKKQKKSSWVLLLKTKSKCPKEMWQIVQDALLKIGRLKTFA